MSASIRRSRLSAPRSALTLIEMLVATAITLLMMAAVVNLFANLTGSISNRRAVIELSGQLRQARQRLSLDLAGATCPAVTWQRPGDDVGYLEIIEGASSDQYPSALVDGDPKNDELDYAASILPRNNLVRDYSQPPDGQVDDDDASVHASNIDSLTPGGLGDYDDVLALTVRSDAEPFVAQVGGNRVESRLAEVVWFSVENPANGLLGEPGMRSIYRRALVISPSIPPQRGPADSQWFFQRNDYSAHYDPTYDFEKDGTADGAWVPNTLGDLTRRENRCYRQSMQGPVSPYPHMMVTGGADYTGNSVNVAINRTNLDTQSGTASAMGVVQNGSVVSYVINDNDPLYDDQPSLRVAGPGLEATARPVLAQVSKNPDAWKLAQITFGPAPLSIHRVPNSGGGSFIVDRTGEDLMLSDALAFDLRVYDPGAQMYVASTSATGAQVAVGPGDPGWLQLAGSPVNPINGSGMFGGYVDMGWLTNYSPSYFTATDPNQSSAKFRATAWNGAPMPLFMVPHQAGYHPVRTPLNNASQYRYPFGYPAEYDTWSLHYESDGIDQDGNDLNGNPTGVDQGTNGLDDDGLNGVDDVAERETSPPYDAPLRGVQIRLRVYERDARQIRETSVTRSLAP